MMRLSTRLAPPLAAGIELRCVPHHQRRFKSFVVKTDKADQYYFEVSRRDQRSRNVEPGAVTEFFEMPDLLLDLDAEDNPNVRTVEEVDENQMTAKWNVRPRQKAVRATLQAFQMELFNSQNSFENVVSFQASMWLPSQCDILSTALLGSPGSIEHQQTRQNDEQKHHMEFLRKLAKKNGIPPHAAKKDVLFLEWLMLRRGTLGRTRPGQDDKIAEALRCSSSIEGIRRIIFQNLTKDLTELPAYASYLGFASHRTLNIPHEVRNACLRVCAESSDKPAAYAEVLGFLGNLSERFSANEIPLGATLHGLALRISAEVGLPAVSSLWINRGYANSVWMHGNQVSEDILATMHAYFTSLGAAHETTGLKQIHERQFLFQVLSGLKDHNLLAPESLRTLSTIYLHEKNDTPAERAFAIYELYIRLLGKFGAVRTLWHEGRAPKSWARNKLESENITRDVEALLQEALLDAVRIAVVPDEEPAQPDPSLGECVTLDYHSMGAQSPDTWRQPRGDSKRKASDEKIVLPSLGFPYDVWIAKIRDIIRNEKMAD